MYCNIYYNGITAINSDVSFGHAMQSLDRVEVLECLPDSYCPLCPAQENVTAGREEIDFGMQMVPAKP